MDYPFLVRAGSEPEIKGIDEIVSPDFLVQGAVDQNAAGVGRIVDVDAGERGLQAACR